METQLKQNMPYFKWVTVVSFLILAIVGGLNMYNFSRLTPDCKALMMEMAPNYDTQRVLEARMLLQNPVCRTYYDAFRASDSVQPLAILQFMVVALLSVWYIARKRGHSTKKLAIYLIIIFLLGSIYAVCDWIETPSLSALVDVANGAPAPGQQHVDAAVRVTAVKSVTLGIAATSLCGLWLWVRFKKPAGGVE